MSLASVFNIAGTGMSAQSTRLNTISSNIAHAETVSSSIDQTYRARHPVFATVFDSTMQGDRGSLFADQDQAGLDVDVAVDGYVALCERGARGDAGDGQRD